MDPSSFEGHASVMSYKYKILSYLCRFSKGKRTFDFHTIRTNRSNELRHGALDIGLRALEIVVITDFLLRERLDFSSNLRVPLLHLCGREEWHERCRPREVERERKDVRALASELRSFYPREIGPLVWATSKPACPPAGLSSLLDWDLPGTRLRRKSPSA